MDFDFSPEQRAFEADVIQFLDANDDPDVFDVTRENMAQIVDTPKRRAFMRSLGERGWLGLTWPKEYGGSESPGVYEYLLVVDGEWLLDPQAVETAPNPFGGLNAVRRVA